MNKRAYGWKMILLLPLFAGVSIAEPLNSLSFYGSMYSDMGTYHMYNSDKNDKFEFRGITSLGLNFQNVNRSYGKVEGSVDLYIPQGAFLESAFSNSGMDTLFVLGRTAPLLIDVRKLYLSVYLPFADVTLGRQIINFGKGYFFSPLDVFSSVEMTDLNLRRKGSDIGMVRFPIGSLSGIDLVVQMPFLDQPYSSAMKLFTTLGGWDLSFVGIYRNVKEEHGLSDETVVGAAFKGDLELGTHGEAVVSFDNDELKPHFEGMLGFDYSIGKKMVLMAEYLYKQQNITGTPWGEHNAFGSVQFTINDLMNVSGNIIHNFDQKLTIGTVQYFYNILQNVNATAYIRGYHGTPLFDAEYAIRVEVKF